MGLLKELEIRLEQEMSQGSQESLWQALDDYRASVPPAFCCCTSTTGTRVPS